VPRPSGKGPATTASRLFELLEAGNGLWQRAPQIAEEEALEPCEGPAQVRERNGHSGERGVRDLPVMFPTSGERAAGARPPLLLTRRL